MALDRSGPSEISVPTIIGKVDKGAIPLHEKCAICQERERRKLSTVCEECAPEYNEWIRSVIRKMYEKK